jgi:outer membrane protein assembly factor BamE
MRKILVPLTLLLASCSAITPYKVDVQQGNAITQEMVAKLKPGMSKSQVRFIMGTPLLTDAFHADRWDYVFVDKKGGKVKERHRVTALFKGDVLERVEGDVTPASGAADAVSKP